MKKGGIFKYFSKPTQIPKADVDTFVGILPKGVTNVTELFDSLFNILLLPGYFGFNWNALSDCLRDFHWFNEKIIILVHEEMPQLLRADLCEYLDVLHECVIDWYNDEGHELIVMFPEDCKVQIADSC